MEAGGTQRAGRDAQPHLAGLGAGADRLRNPVVGALGDRMAGALNDVAPDERTTSEGDQDAAAAGLWISGRR